MHQTCTPRHRGSILNHTSQDAIVIYFLIHYIHIQKTSAFFTVAKERHRHYVNHIKSCKTKQIQSILQKTMSALIMAKQIINKKTVVSA